MQAGQYKLHTCLKDKEGTIHVVFTNIDSNKFIVLYMDGSIYHDVLTLFDKGAKKNIAQIEHWNFMSDCWRKMAFSAHSIVFDDVEKIIFPTITFLQTGMNQKTAYVTNFIPFYDSVVAAELLKIPVYFTERAEAVMKSFNISGLSQYVQDISKRSE